MTNQGNVMTVLLDEGQEQEGRIRYTAFSSIGRREDQQDSLYVGEKGDAILAVVCDGMGGQQGGARASELAVKMLAEAFFGQNPESIPEFYRSMVYQMDEAVYQLKDGEKLLGAGTTIVSVILNDRGLFWLSVGDSKIYLFRQGQMLCPVPEHNYKLILNQLLQSGQIDKEKYERELHKGEALISFLGLGGVSKMEINQNPFRLEPGDQILLCSDGLYKSVSEEEILNTLKLQMSPEIKAKFLVDKALEYGGPKQDNTSVVILQI